MRETPACPGVSGYCQCFLPEADIDIKGCIGRYKTFYRELNVFPYFNKYMVARLKGFSLDYLHVIHFEPSRFNMKIFA